MVAAKQRFGRSDAQVDYAAIFHPRAQCVIASIPGYVTIALTTA